MIKVESMGKTFDIVIEAGEEKVKFTFKQLNYFQRNKIATRSTSMEGGKLLLDAGLEIFFNIKYGLKAVVGLANEDGEPYELRFEGDELEDSCVDELLSCPVSNKLLYAARELGGHIPTEITDPVTNKPIEGIEVVTSGNGKEVVEKK